MITPVVLTRGEPMTYTMDIGNASYSTLDATQAVFVMPVLGSQQFISFNSTNPNWKLRQPAIDPNTNTIYVDLGTVKPGDHGVVTIQATLGTDYNRSIYFNTMYLNWVDSYHTRSKGLGLYCRH